MTVIDSRLAIQDTEPSQVSPGASTPPGAAHESASVPQAPQEATGPGPEAIRTTTPSYATLLDPALALAAAVLDDIERARIANENRLRQLTRTEADSDGLERGFGLSQDHPDVARVSGIVNALKQIEGDAVRNLQTHMKRHPLWPWIKVTRGVGEKQAARLLAAIGDPYLNGATGEVRTVNQLWAYSGLHVLPGGQDPRDAQFARAAGGQLGDHDAPDTHASVVTEGGDPGQSRTDAQHSIAGVAARRRKGVRSNWSSEAKMRAFLIAESCIKQLDKGCRDGHVVTDTHNNAAVPAQDSGAGQQIRDIQSVPACSCSPFRIKYDARRAHTQVTRPEWTDGHRHNDALRVASKEMLKQLFRAAKSWHDRQAEDG